MTRPLATVAVRSSRLSLVRVTSVSAGAILPFMGADVASHIRWMRLRGLSEATVEHRLKVLRLLTTHAARPLLTLTPADLDSWQGTLGPLSLETQRSYKVQVRGYYAWAADEAHLIETNPAAILIIPKVPRDLERALREAPPMIRVWLELAAFAGLRAKEIAALERPDVLDECEPPALVLHGKGSKMRLVPLSPRPLRSLADFGMPARGRLWWVNGRPVSAKRLSQLTNDFLHRLGIPETLHQGRHRYATRLLEAGANLRQVQELMGHASPASTAIYTQVLLRDFVPFVDAIDHPLTNPRPLLRPVPEQETGT
jgi:integrase/recombinase XerC